MYNYHPKFCYGTHTTHGQKVYFLYPFLKYFPLIPRSRLIRIFRVLEYSVYSAFQNIQYFPCFRIFRVFRILEYSVCSTIPPFPIPPNRVTLVGARWAQLFTWMTSICYLSISDESTSANLYCCHCEDLSQRLLHLTILVIVSSPPVKPSCDWFGAREVANLTFLPLCLVLARASWYSATISFLHSEHLKRWR